MSVVAIVALKIPIQSSHCYGFPSSTNGFTIGTDFLKVFEIFCWLVKLAVLLVAYVSRFEVQW